ncbi:MAG: formylglycine-generating enzyme family protein [Myxococcales bacterium]
MRAIYEALTASEEVQREFLPLPNYCAAMTKVVIQPVHRSRPFRYARDLLACWTIFFVGNLCASMTSEHYYGRASTAVPARRMRVEIYSAVPLSARELDRSCAAGNSGQSCAVRNSVALPEARRAESGAPNARPGESNETLLCSFDSHLETTGKSAARDETARDETARDETARDCPSGMQLVDGMHCPILGHTCREFLSAERDRCKTYAPEGQCVGVPNHMRFCIDAFEYPNRAGLKPVVAVNFQRAEEHCREEGKRLCTSTEWELACEGPNRYPYPNGYVRDPIACNFDRPTILVDNNAYANPETREAEIARVDQREASGSRPQCISGYGVHDMAGNVDEWVLNEEGFYNRPPYRSALKGGYWGRVRNRCRPTTTDHNEWHNGYQIGFRCCAGTNQTNRAPANRGSTPIAAGQLIALEASNAR